MYYPQNTPIEIGPTYAIPGTQYHKELMDEDRHNGLPLTGKAGMVSITHFDVGHAAGFNKINIAGNIDFSKLHENRNTQK